MSHDCPICGLPNITIRKEFRTGSSSVDCRRCGEFIITEQVYNASEGKYTFRDVGEKIKENSAALSGLIRLRTDSGAERLVVRTDNIDELLKDTLIPDKDDIEMKAFYFLRAIRRKIPHYGRPVSFDLNEDWSWCFAEGTVEMMALVDLLEDRGHIKTSHTTGKQQVWLTASGWNLLREKQEDSRIGFIAVDFEHDDMDEFIDAMKTAIEDNTGFKAVCLKGLHHSKTIMEKAIFEMRRCRFAVVDLTYGKPSVLFEAGYCHGLQKDIIFVCKDDKFSDASFYAKHFPIYRYKDAEQLKTELTDAIRARIF